MIVRMHGREWIRSGRGPNTRYRSGPIVVCALRRGGWEATVDRASGPIRLTAVTRDLCIAKALGAL